MKALFTVAIGMMLAGTTSIYASEKPIKFEDLPPAVQKTATEQSNGAQIRGYAKEIEKGKTTYEVQLLVNGRTRDLSINPSGQIVETEEEISFDSVPVAAEEVIKKFAGNGQILKVEAVKANGTTVFEAQVNSKKRREIRVNENGQLVPE